jgi:conjugative transposon protein traI
MKKMLLTGLFAIAMLASPKLSAQWVVTDPTNFAQSIINTTQQIVQTSSTAKNMLNNFREVEKLYNQGKEYYDALKKVNNLVKDARKVQETVLLVGDISKMYVTNFKKMSQDPNFSSKELSAIANGYSKLLGESSKLLKDLQQIVNSSSLSMNDKERMDIIDKVHKEVKEYYNLVRYYTQKNISVSYLRAKKQNDAQKVLSLYGTELKYW